LIIRYKENKSNQIHEKMQDEEYSTSFIDFLLNDITANSLTESSLPRPKNIFNNSDMIFK